MNFKAYTGHSRTGPWIEVGSATTFKGATGLVKSALRMNGHLYGAVFDRKGASIQAAGDWKKTVVKIAAKRNPRNSELHNAEEQARKQGWKILQRSQDFPGGGGLAPYTIVLSKTGGVQPFATHHFNRQDGGFHSGHYFESLRDAAADFEIRAVKRNPRNHLGEREFQTYAAWKRALKAMYGEIYIEGNKDIANAFTADRKTSIGEWLGDKGSIYEQIKRNPSRQAKQAPPWENNINLERDLFVKYLRFTLIPDLIAEGKHQTAKDFTMAATIIERRKFPRNKYFSDVNEFVSFLTDTLIPDLENDGYEQTAKDFKTAVDYITESPHKVKRNPRKVMYSMTEKPTKRPTYFLHLKVLNTWQLITMASDKPIHDKKKAIEKAKLVYRKTRLPVKITVEK